MQESLKDKSRGGYYIVDSHCDTLSRAWKMHRDLDILPPPAQSDLGRMRTAGVNLQFLSVFVDLNSRPPSLREYLQQIEFFHQQMEKYAKIVRPVCIVSDIDQAKKKGQLAALLCIEGGEALQGDLVLLQAFYRLGVRSLGLTWNCRNALADGVGERNTRGGLTSFGRSVVREMNRLGMLIDVSHLSEAGFWDVLEISSSPVIASHSNCQSVHDHPRNLTDEQLKGLAKNGGAVGITLVNQFLGPERPRPSLQAVLEHLEHAASIMGLEHVGIGTDFDGVDEPVQELEEVTKLPLLIEGMLNQGFTEGMIRKIMGENYLQIINQVLK